MYHLFRMLMVLLVLNVGASSVSAIPYGFVDGDLRRIEIIRTSHLPQSSTALGVAPGLDPHVERRATTMHTTHTASLLRSTLTESSDTTTAAGTHVHVSFSAGLVPLSIPDSDPSTTSPSFPDVTLEKAYFVWTIVALAFILHLPSFGW
ncbi:uncharacterized protein BXZ73DRAFT_107514 [Epithele typhae]|uniref:uncharacterized protein n=1 Tax=Epithele typhae TaxID=378194 RepID=UPI0020080127|nr:uncharacterized protein BXZ73DRAFT_107514 [Epithele typhae]KAH9912313.1 hypothetical protein BXZ73DRAFT_107514 [Epithele typhae]